MHAFVEKQRFRTIFISDLHLGTRGCKARYLLDFLRGTESDYLYLGGDIVDGWSPERSWYWPEFHDESAMDYAGTRLTSVKVIRNHIHKTADGKLLSFDGAPIGISSSLPIFLATSRNSSDKRSVGLIPLAHWKTRMFWLPK